MKAFLFVFSAFLIVIVAFSLVAGARTRAMGELEGSYVPGVPRYEPAGMRRWIILVVAFMTTLAFMAVAARLWCRHIRKQKFWWDDYLIMFSMVSYLLACNGLAHELLCFESSRHLQRSTWLRGDMAPPC